MYTALIYTALLGTLAILIWLAARKAVRAEMELERAKKHIKEEAAAGEILTHYINMSGDELDECVRKKREALQQRMRSKD